MICVYCITLHTMSTTTTTRRACWSSSKFIEKSGFLTDLGLIFWCQSEKQPSVITLNPILGPAMAEDAHLEAEIGFSSQWSIDFFCKSCWKEAPSIKSCWKSAPSSGRLIGRILWKTREIAGHTSTHYVKLKPLPPLFESTLPGGKSRQIACLLWPFDLTLLEF